MTDDTAHAPQEHTEALDSHGYEAQLRAANEEVYKHSRELAIKNKTLSLLSKLYEISILALEPHEMADRAARTLQKEFDFQFVGIIKADTVHAPLALVASGGMESFANALHIPAPQEVSGSAFINEAIATKQSKYAEDFYSVCSGALPEPVCIALQSSGLIRSVQVHPLVVNDNVKGALLLGLNRSYNDIGQYEREAIQSFINVIAIALDKVLLYEQLKVTNVRLVELDRLKSEFLSLASHQLRAPLSAIKGYASLILEGDFGPVPDALRDSIQRIFASTNSMVRSVEDFLNISRIEQGEMKYDFAEGDFAALAGEMVKRLKPLSDEKGIGLSFVPSNRALNVNMDAYKLEQVLTNLIDNAIKYTVKGEVTITALEHDGMACVRVKDSGVGMSPEAIEKLFQRFARAQGAGKVNVAGTGLGLYVAKQMVEAHKGKIWAESEGEGTGSTFIVELPLSS